MLTTMITKCNKSLQVSLLLVLLNETYDLCESLAEELLCCLGMKSVDLFASRRVQT